MRKSAKRNLRNRAVKSELKTETKRLRGLIKEAKPETGKQLDLVIKKLNKAGDRGYIHPNKRDRLKSRLTKAANNAAKAAKA
jgi:ribosomal protein S20